MTIVMRNSLAVKNIGNGKLGAVLANVGDKTLIGTISGIANGIKRGKLPDGVTPTIGLVGDFEGTPADTTKDIVRAGVCYLPEGLQNPIIAALTEEVDGTTGKVTKAAATSISFAFEIYSVKAANPAGFNWEFVSAIPLEENDPLAGMREKLAALRAARAPAQIEAPKGK